MGGRFGRPRNGVKKITKSGFGVSIQPSSNLLYQKFLKIGRLPLASLAVSPPQRLAPPKGGAQSPQKFFQFLLRGARKFFSNKVKTFAGFVSLLTQGEPLPTLCRTAQFLRTGLENIPSWHFYTMYFTKNIV